MEEGIAIHLAPSVVGHIGNFPVTSTLLMSWVIVGLLALGAFVLRRKLSLVPGRLQTVVEAAVAGAYDYLVEAFDSEKLARRFFPLIATIFLFILTANWAGLLPGVTGVGLYQEHHGEVQFTPFLFPVHSDLNMTVALAIISFFTIEVTGILTLGFLKYGSKFVTFRAGVMGFFVGIVELIGNLARLISLSFRLFGNVFAGEVLLLVIAAFLSLVVPVPFMAFEFFIGFLQAAIFALLTVAFIRMAVEEPHGTEYEGGTVGAGHQAGSHA